MDDTQKKSIQAVVLETIRQYNQNSAFAERKVTDTPTDSFALVNRRYVNLNGAVASRPVSSVAVAGQKYFATDTLIPMTYSAGGWVNGVGSIVALNN